MIQSLFDVFTNIIIITVAHPYIYFHIFKNGLKVLLYNSYLFALIRVYLLLIGAYLLYPYFKQHIF